MFKYTFPPPWQNSMYFSSKSPVFAVTYKKLAEAWLHIFP